MRRERFSRRSEYTRFRLASNGGSPASEWAAIASMMIQPQALIKGRYRVGRRLGEGGMAIVYLGHDLLLGRDVAIKTPRPQFSADPGFRARFEREARAAASLSHPNIIDVYDVGEDDGTPFIVMELVRGQSLKEIIAADAPFHPDDVAELLEQIGGALDYAHARGYVHRDIKPGNILIDEHGRARLVDFGIAKGLADGDLTEAGASLGTVGYLSPEQAAGLMATPASDVYSAGVVAFEMLTGELPFAAETPVGVAMRHVHDPAPRPSHVVPGLPPQVDPIILRALAKDPTRRWGSAGAFARALRDWRNAGPPPPVTRAPQAVAQRRHPARGSLAPTIVIVVLVLAALAALLWTGFATCRIPPSRRRHRSSCRRRRSSPAASMTDGEQRRAGTADRSRGATAHRPDAYDRYRRNRADDCPGRRSGGPRPQSPGPDHRRFDGGLCPSICA